MSLLVWNSRLGIVFPQSQKVLPSFLAASVAIKKGGIILIPDTFYETSFLIGSFLGPTFIFSAFRNFTELYMLYLGLLS